MFTPSGKFYVELSCVKEFASAYINPLA